MGRGCGNAEGAWSRLGEDDPGYVAELATNLVDESAACLTIGLASHVTLGKECFNAGSRSANQTRRAAVEPATPGLARLRPSRGDIALKIVLGTSAEATVNES